MMMVCDGIYDCLDHSDELECSLLTNLRNRTKKDDMAAIKLAKQIGLLIKKEKQKFKSNISFNLIVEYTKQHTHTHSKTLFTTTQPYFHFNYLLSIY